MLVKVCFGEVKTPMIRPKGLIRGCASGADMEVVAIAASSTTE
jgi:hypothetical protein